MQFPPEGVKPKRTYIFHKKSKTVKKICFYHVLRHPRKCPFFEAYIFRNKCRISNFRFFEYSLVLREDVSRISESSSYSKAPSGSARFKNGARMHSVGVCAKFCFFMFSEQVNLNHERHPYGKIGKKY